MARLVVVEDFAGPSVVHRGGQAMRVLQVLEGLRRLGHDILLVEFLSEATPPDAVAYFHQALNGRWDPRRAAMLDASTGQAIAGVPSEEVRRFAADAQALISLAAHYRREPWPLLGDLQPRILFEQDPGYTHLWADDGDPLDIFGEHDVHFTVGANVGTALSSIPASGIDWRALWPPVVLDWWPVGAIVERDRFTTVGAWRDYGYLEFDGQILGPKVEEFQKFLDLPRHAGEQLELTLAIDEDDPDREMLREYGWRLEDPALVGTPELYRAYVTSSLAEFSCAKGGYVGTHSGWFSDRSACYLAAGRPVITQQTGFTEYYGGDGGLFAFETLEEIAEAVRAINAEYPRHSRAAFDIAAEHFEATKVLGSLLRRANI